MASFTMEGKQFIYNGEPIRILSGAMHYFRIVPEYWKDRLLKLKACGFNTVETYVAWNVHEPKEGQFNFQGIADVERFVQLAGELGLHVIIRPSPYICAEWEFGGLPYWLLKDPSMQLRCYYKPYLDKIDTYYDEILARFKPLLCTNGGPIIAMQIENEYGSYGTDKEYLAYIRQAMIIRGMDVLLFTSDGYDDSNLQGGTLIPDVFATVNFGSRPEEAFAKLQEYQQDKPLVCMEYWNGWFDYWGNEHHQRGHDDVVDVLERMLELGASVNFYMFHGGTNFGFYNGAGFLGKHEPVATSYDYHAMLNESGDITDKYIAVRELLSKYVDLTDIEIPSSNPKKHYGTVRLTEQTKLFDSLDQLSSPVKSKCPITMEQLDQDYGFILYTTQISGPRAKNKLVLQQVRDRALIFLDGVYQGTVERNTHDQTVELKENDILVQIPPEGATLSILVENMGRINYGYSLKDPKGITEGVRFERGFLHDWKTYSLPLNNISELEFGDKQESGSFTPTFYKGKFHVDEVGDTFLKLEGWMKGVAYINGYNLGRYWDIGPQKTLYIPGPLLREGENELIVFELHGTNDPIANLQDFAELG
ncbi:beta-galactosidase [Paenibacillus sp. LMG 31461]|uniref:Beta-galactosidase n=1 Tax=Paenibacillus plantarum TaxID=2654975 RepID=A0ABX1X5Y6_9BACL|nr:beta-galactosidase family protein [Paenibacillus plantarum]NOU63714.1 beta-galactosidase [Paenibacillus plantarum]